MDLLQPKEQEPTSGKNNEKSFQQKFDFQLKDAILNNFVFGLISITKRTNHAFPLFNGASSYVGIN